jgi:site-specific DNA recombinase
MLRNPMYAGNIVINDASTSSKYLIPGLHRAIVSTPTFNKVQELFYRQKKGKDSTKRNTRYTDYLLKGFVNCPRCFKLLPASSSTGRNQSYSYYHCHNSCGYRTRCEKLHVRLIEKLQSLKPRFNYFTEFGQLIQLNYHKESRKLNLKKTKNIQSIELFTEGIYKAGNLLLDGHLEYQQYADIKLDLEAKIRMMGYSIEAISKKQIDLAEKV